MPLTKAAAYAATRVASSPGTSCARPHRGSRIKLMFGANSHTCPDPSLYSARDSVPMARPTSSQSCKRSSVVVLNGCGIITCWSNAAPSAMGAGKEVGHLSGDKHPVHAPCSASPDDMEGTPRRGIAGTPASRIETFSSGDIRERRSATRMSTGSEVLQ